jgi:hypothetical protein
MKAVKALGTCGGYLIAAGPYCCHQKKERVDLGLAGTERAAACDRCLQMLKANYKLMAAIGVKGVTAHSLWMSLLESWTLIDVRLSSAFRRASCLIEQSKLETIGYRLIIRYGSVLHRLG